MKLLFLFISFIASAAQITYTLNLRLDQSGSFQGVSHITFPCRDGDFIFRLYPNHFGRFVSVAAAFVEGAEAAWEALDPTVVAVRTDRPCSKMTSVLLEFVGQLPLETHGYGILHHEENVMLLSQFYPILAPWENGWLVHPTFPVGDNLVAEAADYVLTVEVPDNWLPVGSGREENQTANIWRLTGVDLREMGLVLVRNFGMLSHEGPSEVMLRAFHPPELAHSAQEALKIAAEALELFAKILGPFPYPDLDIVFVPLTDAAGVEYPRLILVDEYYAHDTTNDFFAEIVVHELAHQWWYGEVGTDQVAEPWLDEGLATYTSALYFEAKGKLEGKVTEWKTRWERAQRLYPYGSVGGGLWDFAKSFAARQSYSGYVYAGAALFLHAARQLLGDEVFFRALQRFRTTTQFKIAKASEFLKILREEGADLDELMNSYFRTPRL